MKIIKIMKSPNKDSKYVNIKINKEAGRFIDEKNKHVNKD